MPLRETTASLTGQRASSEQVGVDDPQSSSSTSANQAAQLADTLTDSTRQALIDTVSMEEVRSLAAQPFTDSTLAQPTSRRGKDAKHAATQLEFPLVAPGGNRSIFYRATKRTIDIVGSLTILTLAFPFLFVAWLVLMVTTRGRPFFCQERIGLCGQPFPCFKFRTMVLNAESLRHLVGNEQDGPVFKNRRDPRITRVGAWLGKTSIDEIPQLFNVLLGHMSLVGPRPPIASEVEEYEDWQRERLSVKPGITCLWQVSGRCQIGFTEWMKMDMWYVENQSLKTDLSLLLRTPWAVLSCRGAC